MTTQLARLPDGKSVRISNEPQTWWTEDGASGFLDPHLLAPDPDQPRKVLRKEDLADLRQSVVEFGVRQHIVITPRALAPWAKVDAKYEKLPFVVVSGHRRRYVSIDSSIPAVPVIVRTYADEEQHRIDAYVLNKQGRELSPIEEGWEIVRLNKSGVSLAKIAKSTGDSLGYVEGRRNLTQLLPAIQSLIDPELPPKRRLPLTVAGELGGVGGGTREEIEQLHITYSEAISAQRTMTLVPREDVWNLGEELLRFELQKILLAAIQHRKMSALQGVEFIKERKLLLSSSGHKASLSERFQPARRKAILLSMAQSIAGSKAADWTPAEFERIFETATAEDVDACRVAMNGAISLLTDIAVLLARIRDRKIKPAAQNGRPQRVNAR